MFNSFVAIISDTHLFMCSNYWKYFKKVGCALIFFVLCDFFSCEIIISLRGMIAAYFMGFIQRVFGIFKKFSYQRYRRINGNVGNVIV